MDYKLIYEAEAQIKGSASGIPADTDAVLMSREDVEGYKLVYRGNDNVIYGSTTGIPNAETDTPIFPVTEVETEVTEDEIVEPEVTETEEKSDVEETEAGAEAEADE